MLQTCLILTFHLVSAQTIPTIKPRFLPDCMGQSFNQHESFDIVNSTGFLGIHYLYYGHILVYDYILKPGRSATILYAEHGGPSSDIVGDFQFFHGNNDVSHSGVNIQTTTINATTDSAYSKITILANKDTEQGTYWLIFPPGLCSGGNVILLTIGDSLELVPQIGTLKAHIENHETDDVIVINSSPYVLANLTLLDPAGKIERAYEIMVDPNGNSARWFTPTQNGNYAAVITSAIGNMTISFTVSGVEEPLQRIGNPINPYDSPLKQFKMGTSEDIVKCNNDLQIVIKAEDGSPACVKPDTAKKLIERGWAIEKLDPRSTSMNLEVYGSYDPGTLSGHFLKGSLSSIEGPISNGNVTIYVNGISMGQTVTDLSGCFQFNRWDDKKLSAQINETRQDMEQKGVLDAMNLKVVANYPGNENHDAANVTKQSYLYLWALPLPPPNYQTTTSPSVLNVTQGYPVHFELMVKPFTNYSKVDKMKLSVEQMPCGVTDAISYNKGDDRISTDHPGIFNVTLNTSSYTPTGTYLIMITQDTSGLSNPNIDHDVTEFALKVLPKNNPHK